MSVWQPVEPAETPTAPTVASPLTKAEVQPQAQSVAQQQTTPPSVVSTTSQQTPSSPAPPQRPARRKQPGPAQQPAAQPLPSKAPSGQPPAPLQQQIAQHTLADVSQKEAEMVSFPLVSTHLQTSSQVATLTSPFNRLLLRLPRQPKAINTNWVMLWRALLLEMQWAMVQSSHKKLMETSPLSSKSRPHEKCVKYKSSPVTSWFFYI